MKAKLFGLILASVLLFGLAGGCAHQTPEHKVLRGCEAYEQILRSLAVRRVNGELSRAQVRKVENVRPVLNDICMGGTPPKDTEAHKILEHGLDTLIRMREMEEVGND